MWRGSGWKLPAHCGELRQDLSGVSPIVLTLSEAEQTAWE